MSERKLSEMPPQEAFDYVMGDCSGTDIMDITEDDITKSVEYLRSHEPDHPIDEDDIQNVLDGMYLYQTKKPILIDEWEIRDDGGSYDTLECSVDDLDEAIEDWVKEGEWGDGGCLVNVHYEQLCKCPHCEKTSTFYDITKRRMDQCPHCNGLIDFDDISPEEGSHTVGIEQNMYNIDEYLKELEDDDHEHRWENPYEIVGGLKENPGVHGGPGVQITTHSVCACGAHQYQDYDRQRFDQGQGLEYIYKVDYPNGLWPWGRKCKYPGQKDNSEEIIHEITEAQSMLNEGLDKLRSALEQCDEKKYAYYDGYILAHLDNWINGGNTMDDTIPKIIHELEDD